VVVYKIDRLTRSLTDFAKLVDVLDPQWREFRSSRSNSTPPPRWDALTLNILLSFARNSSDEVTGERIRDKIAASKAKGMWMAARHPSAYDVVDRKLPVNEPEAD
jgi:DNA invertase Pin-like site-specific DNA recombinase